MDLKENYQEKSERRVPVGSRSTSYTYPMPLSASSLNRFEETKRIARVLRIICLISSQPRVWSRRAFAERFEVSERMVDKDLDLIRNGLGYALSRSGGGYAFEREPAIRPLNLPTAEALALLLSAQAALATGSADRPTLAAAIARIEDALPRALAAHARRAGTTELGPLESPTHDRGAVLMALQQAQAEGRKLQMIYASASHGGAESERTVSPYALVPHDGSWFVIAHDSVHDAVRLFNVDRVVACELTADHYAIPADFSLDAYFGDTWGVVRGMSSNPVDVSIRFSATSAAWVRETRRHPSQRIESLPDGGARVRFHCGITPELVRWVLWYGGDADVEAPAQLKAAVRREAERVLQAGLEAGQ